MNASGATSMVPRSTRRRLLGLHHVVERVIERPQIGIDLLLYVTGQKPELLTSLDRRPRQDDPADLLGHQIADGLSHGQVGLARSAGPTPKTMSCCSMASR
jgi:hypothetical protein